MHRTPARQDFRRNIVSPDPRPAGRPAATTSACRKVAPWAGAPWGAPCPQARHQLARRPARATPPRTSLRGGQAAWPRSSWRRLQARDCFECCHTRPRVGTSAIVPKRLCSIEPHWGRLGPAADPRPSGQCLRARPGRDGSAPRLSRVAPGRHRRGCRGRNHRQVMRGGRRFQCACQRARAGQ
jgi:hypothetical protein